MEVQLVYYIFDLTTDSLIHKINLPYSNLVKFSPKNDYLAVSVDSINAIALYNYGTWTYAGTYFNHGINIF